MALPYSFLACVPLLKGYNRGATISNSELTQIGDSPIAMWGYTKSEDIRSPPGTGIDGSDGNQPRGTQVVGNMCHEYGEDCLLLCSSSVSSSFSFSSSSSMFFDVRVYTCVCGCEGTYCAHAWKSLMHASACENLIVIDWHHCKGMFQKQSSCVMMAKSMETNISRNVMFNAARAHINQNDGFGGGTTVQNNLIYSACRESSDHGPFYSWDRQPFVWENSEAGTPNLQPKTYTIAANFFLANYGSGQSVDNDDGSSYYDIKNNVMYGAGGLKSDYAGASLLRAESAHPLSLLPPARTTTTQSPVTHSHNDTSSHTGHDKRFHGNLNVGGGGCGMYCFYQLDHQDQCFNNTFILPHPRPHATSTATSPSQWADLRGCSKTQQVAPRCGSLHNPYGGGASPIMLVHGNTVFNHNESTGDVACGQDQLSAAEFNAICGVDVGTSSSTIPSDAAIATMIRQWLSMVKV